MEAVSAIMVCQCHNGGVVSNILEWEQVLYKGKHFKNYKDMCSQLQLQPTTGKSKQLQFKELGRFCEYHTEGHQIVIDEVFDEPEPKIDGRHTNSGNLGNAGNSVYGELMDTLIINMFLRHKNLMYGTVLSFSQVFMGKIPLLSNTYGEIYNMGGAHVYAYNKALSVGLVTEYIVKTREILKKCFETALNRLQRKGLIEWEKSFVIKMIPDESEVATAEQEEIIRKCEQEAYEELKMGYYHRINPDKNQKFKETVIKKLQQLISSRITSYWTGYSICFWQEDYEVEEDVEEVFRELQELIVKRVHKAVINKSCTDKNTGERFTPYKADTHLRAISQLDYEIWNQLSRSFKDELNEEFAKCIYGEDVCEKEYLFNDRELA